MDQDVFKWLHRVHGLPSPLRGLALRLLALRSPRIAAEVKALLNAGTRTDTILDRQPHTLLMPVQTKEDGLSNSDADDRIGSRLGAWRIIGFIGRGGMGTVYQARRDDGMYEREVALKCIHRELTGAQALNAFQNERNALAALNHRGIVPILDSGVDEDGTPWFVMPLVRGIPIDTWCDQQNLGIRERVALFTQVCDALAYAHAHGVLHQDIKASAILVTPDGNPNLLDFGLATLTPDHGVHPSSDTNPSSHFAFSPGYSAPEMALGSKPSVAIDLYALGVLLYILLCGRRPDSLPIPQMTALVMPESAAPSQVTAEASTASCLQRNVRNPKELEKILAGDLDRIVLCCIRHAPEQRYPSVEALKRDLGQWLGKRPISLRDGIGYKTGLFFRRNAVRASVTAALAALVVAAIGATLWQHRAATNEAELASRIEQVFSRSLGSTALSRMGDMSMSSTQLLEQAEAQIRRYTAGDDPKVLARSLSILARSLSDAGSYDKAEALLAESIAISNDSALEFAFNQVTLAHLHNLRARYAQAEQDSLDGLDRLRFRFSQHDRLAAVQLKAQLANALTGQGKSAEAMTTLDTAIEDASRLSSPSGRMALAQLLVQRGTWYRHRMQLAPSAEDLERAILLSSSIEPRIADDARESLMRTVRYSRTPGREIRALAIAQELLRSRQQTLGDKHPQTGVAWGELAFMQIINQDYDDAQASIDTANGILAESVGNRHSAYARVMMAQSVLSSIAGRSQDAVSQATQALAILREVHGERHELTLDARLMVAGHAFGLPHTPEERNKVIDDFRSAIDAYVSAHGTVAAVHRAAAASQLVQNGRLEEARAEVALTLQDSAKQYGIGSQEMLNARLTQITLLVAEGKEYDRALQELDQLITDTRAFEGLYAKAILFSAYLRKSALLLSQSNDRTQARAVLEEAKAIAVSANSGSWIAAVDAKIKALDEGH